MQWRGSVIVIGCYCPSYVMHILDAGIEVLF